MLPAVDELPADLLELRRGMHSEKGAVASTVLRAIEDYLHLRRVVMGPGATADAVDDVTLLAEAEQQLRSMMERAPELQVLVSVASSRQEDRAGREAAGDAMLKLRDQGRLLHELASAALQWASSQSIEDCEKMKKCASRLA